MITLIAPSTVAFIIMVAWSAAVVVRNAMVLRANREMLRIREEDARVIAETRADIERSLDLDQAEDIKVIEDAVEREVYRLLDVRKTREWRPEDFKPLQVFSKARFVIEQGHKRARNKLLG